MNDDYAIVTISNASYSAANGDYYVAKNNVEYLTSDLGNSGSSSITLYSSLDNHSYNYITVSSLGSASFRYQSGNSYATVSISGDVSFSPLASFYKSQIYIQSGVYFLLALFCIKKVVFK